MPSPYVYSNSHIKRSVPAVFNDDNTLHSIHGFEVDSYIILKPALLEAFKKHSFSNDFLRQYKSGIFQISHVQPDVLYTYSSSSEIAITMNDKHCVNEMLEFCKENRKLLHTFGWDDTPIHYFAIDVDSIEPVHKFLSITFPKTSL